MKKIYALLIAINDYPNPRHRLAGCRNDLLQFKSYLEANFPSENEEFKLEIETLIDEQAKRENIVKGFEHFTQAKGGDVCVLFFAGHGSRWESPKEFLHMEPDGMIESIVCWDSRQDGGRDLMDKELSYLIWKSIADKNVHFLAIMDCCHSGTLTRKRYLNTRDLETGTISFEASSFLGFEQYLKVGEDFYRPPIARHVQISAARSTQTAKEVYAKGAPRGIFTYCLIEALENTKNQLSYSELIKKINFRLRNNVNDQIAQLFSVVSEDRDRIFINGSTNPKEYPFLIGYDNKHGWIINAGEIHGIKVFINDLPIVVKLKHKQHETEIIETHPNFSKIKGMAGFDKKKTYPAKINVPLIKNFTFFISERSDEQSVAMLSEIYKEINPGLFSINNQTKNGSYMIHADSESFYITKPHEKRPLFKKVSKHSKESAAQFLNHLALFTNWHNVISLENSYSTIQKSDIEIELFKALDPDRYEENEVPLEPINWENGEEFSYILKNGEWQLPAFQLKLVNNGKRNLWVSLLYCGYDYSITNELITIQCLAPGEEVWAEVFDNENKKVFRTHPLELADDLYEWGINSVQEYFKVLVCTDEFESDNYNQPALENEKYQSQNRILKRVKGPKPEDWRTLTFPISLYRPFKAKALNHNSITHLLGIQIESPKGFYAQSAPSTIEKLIEELDEPDLLSQFKSSKYVPYEIGIEESKQEICVLTFSKVDVQESISAPPLKIWKKNGSIEIPENLQIWIYQLKVGWRPIGFTKIQNCIEIMDLNLSEDSDSFSLLFITT